MLSDASFNILVAVAARLRADDHHPRRASGKSASSAALQGTTKRIRASIATEYLIIWSQAEIWLTRTKRQDGTRSAWAAHSHRQSRNVAVSPVLSASPSSGSRPPSALFPSVPYSISLMYLVTPFVLIVLLGGALVDASGHSGFKVVRMSNKHSGGQHARLARRARAANGRCPSRDNHTVSRARSCR